MNQDKLFVDFSTSIDRTDPKLNQRALEAASRRKKRIGQYALGMRGKGFSKSIKNLWIPYSGTENTAVIQAPEPKIVREKYATERRVKEKYADTDVSGKAVKNWARFASMNTEQELRKKFRSFLFDSNYQIANLSDALSKDDSSYSFDSITGSDLAIGAMSKYLISLKSFAGIDENGEFLVKRRWIQERWTKVMAEEKNEAINYIEKQNNESLFYIYEEAYFNNWCRQKYWANVEIDYRNYVNKARNIEPEIIEVPLEAYEDSPYLWDESIDFE